MSIIFKKNREDLYPYLANYFNKYLHILKEKRSSFQGKKEKEK